MEWKGLAFKGLQELSRPNLSETASRSFALGEVDRWTNLQIGTRKNGSFASGDIPFCTMSSLDLNHLKLSSIHTRYCSKNKY